jgi:hypothetical protein
MLQLNRSKKSHFRTAPADQQIVAASRRVAPHIFRFYRMQDDSDAIAAIIMRDAASAFDEEGSSNVWPWAGAAIGGRTVLINNIPEPRCNRECAY